ncbi:hypothetical protein [Paraburkholderia youngii]|uniref:hypothetical protein n=1 Tax=Paraburkholderia youngii TaxID=2782701 RepID=UPI003D260D03
MNSATQRYGFVSAPLASRAPFVAQTFADMPSDDARFFSMTPPMPGVPAAARFLSF